MEQQTAVPRRGGPTWILTISLAWGGVILLYTSSIFFGELSAGFPVFLLVLFLLFALLFFLFAYLTWRHNKWGYLGGAATSIIFLALESPQILQILSNPGNPQFFSVLSFVVAAPIAAVYGGYNFYSSRRPLAVPRQISRASVLGLVALGFVLGGALVGVIAGATQTRLLASATAGKDVSIAIGAANPNNPQSYVPGSFTVSVGKTVVWFNGDTAAHTVTSTTNLFDSGNLDSGTTFRFTFTQPGTYTYTCSYHPFMKGTIVVTG